MTISLAKLRIFYIFFVLAMATTILRQLILPILPIISAAYFFLFSMRLEKRFYFIFTCILFSLLSTIAYQWQVYPANYFLSLFHILPIFALLFSAPLVSNTLNETNHTRIFFRIFSYFMLINSAIGFIRFIQRPSDPHVFAGLYGEDGLGIHGLAHLYVPLIGYWGYRVYYSFRWQSASLLIVFFISFVLCRFGLALAVLFLTIVLCFASFKQILHFVSMFFLFVLGLVLLYNLDRGAFEYNLRYMGMLQDFLMALFGGSQYSIDQFDHFPGKFILYLEYANVFFKDIFLFIMGNGPGTFNSRSYFLLNGDYSDLFMRFFNPSQPELALKHVYPLWNSNLLTVPHRDGTANQPFSAIIALLSEYGLITSSIAFYFFVKKYQTLKGILDTHLKVKIFVNHREIAATKGYIKFISVYFFIALFGGNYLEYPEIAVVFILSLKIIEFDYYASLNRLEKLGR